MKIYLVRHGETFDNVSGLIAGHLPGKLTEKGRKQSHNAGLDLMNLKFDKVYCSDLARTRQTFDEIQNICNFECEIVYTEKVRERFFGEYEGFYQKEFKWTLEDVMAFRNPQNGESCNELLARANEFLEELKESQAESVLVVSHCQFLKAFLCAFNGSGLDEYFTMEDIKNASITIIEI